MTRQSYSMKALAVCLAALSSVCCVAAQAGETDEPQFLKTTVKYADLNLATSQGAEALYRRIRWAAERVCSPADVKDLGALTSRKDCIEKAMAEAVTDVGSPTLTAVYEANQGAARRAAATPAVESPPVG